MTIVARHLKKDQPNQPNRNQPGQTLISNKNRLIKALNILNKLLTIVLYWIDKEKKKGLKQRDRNRPLFKSEGQKQTKVVKSSTDKLI